MKRQRKLFCEYGPVFYKISSAKESAKRRLDDLAHGRRFARRKHRAPGADAHGNGDPPMTGTSRP
jgi:hypothetical protein